MSRLKKFYEIPADFRERTRESLKSAQKVYYVGELKFLRYSQGLTWIDKDFGRLFLPGGFKATDENIYRIADQNLKPVEIKD